MFYKPCILKLILQVVLLNIILIFYLVYILQLNNLSAVLSIKNTTKEMNKLMPLPNGLVTLNSCLKFRPVNLTNTDNLMDFIKS